MPIGRLAGIASIFIDGVAYDAAGDLEYQATSRERKPLVGLGGEMQGWEETGKPGYIKVTLRDNGALSTQDLYDNVNVPVVAMLANGKTVSGDDMTCMEAMEVKNADGTFTATFNGPRVRENKGAPTP